VVTLTIELSKLGLELRDLCPSLRPLSCFPVSGPSSLGPYCATCSASATWTSQKRDGHVGEVPIGSLSPEGWRAWYIEQTVLHRGSTQPGKAYRLARTMLNTAVGDGLLRVNPCRVKGAGIEHAPERPVVMPEQVAQLAAAIDPRYRTMVLFAAYCSLRFGEVAGLRRSRVDVVHRTGAVEDNAVETGGRVEFGPPKTVAGRRLVAIPDELADLLDRHLAEHVGPEPDALLFPDRDGNPPGRNKFRPIWATACAASDITGLHFHDLRGSEATWAAASGVTVRELMDRPGHTTPTVALRYQHATQERDRAIADRLGALMRAATLEPDEPAAPVTRIDR